MVLILVVVLIGFLFFRQAGPKADAPRTAAPVVPTASPEAGTQSTTADDGFVSLLGLIKNLSDDAVQVVQTTTQKN